MSRRAGVPAQREDTDRTGSGDEAVSGAMRLRCTSAAVVAAALLAPGPAQRPALGDPAPLTPALDLQGVSRALSDVAGPKGLVVLFWAGWSERSINELSRLNAGQRDITAHGVGIVAVNVEHQTAGAAELAAVRDRVAKLGVTVPVLVDDGLKLFKAYGVISVPSTALVGTKGELVYFSAGYAPGEREALFDAVEKLAGIQKASAPVAALPAVPPAALRRLQMGRLELANRRASTAKATFEALVAAEPTFVEPLVELAAMALDERDLATAEGLLNRGGALQADHPAVAREKARMAFAGGKVAEAETALQTLGAAAKDPVADAYLGFVLAVGGRAADASAAFDRAMSHGGVDPRGFIADTGERRAAEAMTAYRRAAARR